MSKEWEYLRWYQQQAPAIQQQIRALWEQGNGDPQFRQAMANIWRQSAPAALEVANTVRTNPQAQASLVTKVVGVTSATTAVEGIVIGGVVLTSAMLWELFLALVFCLIVVGVVYWGLKEMEQKTRLHKSSQGANSGAFQTAFDAAMNDPQYSPLICFKNRHIPAGIELPKA